MASIYSSSKIAKNTLIMYIRMLFIIAINFYTSRVILQNLGIEDFGIYNVVGGIVALFTFLNTAMGQATQRFLAYELGKNEIKHLNHIFIMTLNIHAIIAIVIAIIVNIVGNYLIYHYLNIPTEKLDAAFWVLQFSIIATFFTITQVPFNAILNAHEKFKIYAIISIIDALLKLTSAASLTFIAENLKLLYYGFLMLITIIIITSIYKIYCYNNFKETHWKPYWNKIMFKQLSSYTSWSLIGNIAGTASDQGVNIILNSFCGPTVNAARGIAMQIKTALATFVYNFQGASIPQIIKLYASQDYNAMMALVMQSSKISFFLFFYICLPIWLELPYLLKLWLVEVPEYLTIFTRLILLNILLQSMSGTLQTLIQATGKIKKYQLTVGILQLTIFPLSYICLHIGLKPEITIIISCIISIFICITQLCICRQIINFSICKYIKEVLLKDITIFMLGIIIPSLLYYFHEESFYRLLSIGTICFLINPFIIYFNGFNKNERKTVKQFILYKIKNGKKN
ncbi:MATE family efflux transporter [uncultured Bacteroides sp.]|jgi:hypothetical protein|uniref:lipopolysaccharide biosynthesis protein n=1 Tax=uncultured Bacteroides sp. TaxID=162156 RepID=UPI00280AFD81|nr:MATE family efflux transporter [uncultured Bacteroides sp.]